MVERHPEAIPSPRGYQIDCYCQNVPCDSQAVYTADGPNAYFQAHKSARRAGWILHRDGYATCPKCSGKQNRNLSS